MKHQSDFLIIGAGIIGLCIAKTLLERYPKNTIIILEKESDVALHASGRNSGVLHAGFYYTADSLKARFTKEGNAKMKAFCREHGLAINPCGKVVVAQNPSETERIRELYRRGLANGVDVSIIDEDALQRIDPNAKTCEIALHSPTTATVDPKAVMQTLKKAVVDAGAKLFTETAFLARGTEGEIRTNRGLFRAKTVINCAGLYADKIAQAYGFGDEYTMLPFKGIYLKYSGTTPPVRTNIYPVPGLDNPFLGVHYTITADGSVKIGPTAIPAFWRENYHGFERFAPGELVNILRYDALLFLTDRFHFRSLAMEEFRKYSKTRLARLAKGMVKSVETKKFDTWSAPGIRAQLLHKKRLELVQDFVVEGDARSVHILNAVSPAFTCSFAFAEWIVEHYIRQ